MGSACTKACGKLPWSWCCRTSYSSAKSPGDPTSTAPARTTEPRGYVAGLEAGKRQPEVTDQERAFGVPQRPSSRVAVNVALVGSPRTTHRVAWLRGSSAGRAAGSPPIAVRRRPDRHGSPFPTTARVNAVRSLLGGSRRRDQVSVITPGRPAPGKRPQAGHGDQPALGPSVGIEIPDGGIRSRLPGMPSAATRRPPSLRHPAARSSGPGQTAQRLPEHIQLELVLDPIPDDVVPARMSGQVERLHVGNRQPSVRYAGDRSSPSADSQAETQFTAPSRRLPPPEPKRPLDPCSRSRGSRVAVVVVRLPSALRGTRS